MSVEIGDFDSDLLRRWKKSFLRASWLQSALILILSYILWTEFIQFLSLTTMTYFLGKSNSSLQEINEVWASYRVNVISFSTLSYLTLLGNLHPISSIGWSEIFDRSRFEKFFVGSLLLGCVLSGALVLSLILLGSYQYLGLFIQIGAVPSEAIVLILRILLLLGWTYSEEFIFRKKLTSYFQPRLPLWLRTQLIAFAYCSVKALQFDLSAKSLISIYLLSLTLSLRAEQDKPFEVGAGYWAAALMIVQPIAGLPLFGAELGGTLMVKSSETFNLLSGGTEGPISGLVFQLLLLLDLTRGMLRLKPQRKV